jgi:GxxExxY protein
VETAGWFVACEHDAWTSAIINASIEVHSSLGPGFLESIYNRSFTIESRTRGFEVEIEKEIVVFDEKEDVGQPLIS